MVIFQCISKLHVKDADQLKVTRSGQPAVHIIVADLPVDRPEATRVQNTLNSFLPRPLPCMATSYTLQTFEPNICIFNAPNKQICNSIIYLRTTAGLMIEKRKMESLTNVLPFPCHA